MTKKLCLCVPLLLVAGCTDMFATKSSRNFDELIPRMIGAMDKRTPEEAATNLFNVTSPDERRDAIAYLQTKKWGHEPPYMRAYEILTTDPHPMVRAQAMRALGTSYQPASADLLAKGLADADVQVRRDAAYGLITTWNDAAFTALIAHVHPPRQVETPTADGETDELVRGYCARALLHAQSPDAIRALIDALRDQDPGVASFAHASLVTLTRQDLSYNTKAWLTWYQQTYMSSPTSAPAATRAR